MVNCIHFTELTVRNEVAADKLFWYTTNEEMEGNSLFQGAVVRQCPFLLTTSIWKTAGSTPRLGDSFTTDLKLDGDIAMTFSVLVKRPAIAAYRGSGDDIEVAKGEDCPYYAKEGGVMAMFKSISMKMLGVHYDEKTSVSLYRDANMFNEGDHKQMLGVHATVEEAQLDAKRTHTWMLPVRFAMSRGTTNGLRLSSAMLTAPKLTIELNELKQFVVNPNAACYPNIGVRADGVADDDLVPAPVVGGTPCSTPCSGLGATPSKNVRPLRDEDFCFQFHATYALLGDSESDEMTEATSAQFAPQTQHDKQTFEIRKALNEITRDTRSFKKEMAIRYTKPIQMISLYARPSGRADRGEALNFKGVFDPVSQTYAPIIKSTAILCQQAVRQATMPAIVSQHGAVHNFYGKGKADDGHHFVFCLDPLSGDFTGASNNAHHMQMSFELEFDPMAFKETDDSTIEVLAVAQVLEIATYQRKVFGMSLSVA